MDNKKQKKRIMKACYILMKECYNNDSDKLQVEFEYNDLIVKINFDFSTYPIKEE